MKKIHHGDKIVFYVNGTKEIQGIFEVVGDWYETDQPVWSDDEPNGSSYSSQIKINPIKIGSLNGLSKCKKI